MKNLQMKNLRYTLAGAAAALVLALAPNSQAKTWNPGEMGRPAPGDTYSSPITGTVLPIHSIHNVIAPRDCDTPGLSEYLTCTKDGEGGACVRYCIKPAKVPGCDGLCADEADLVSWGLDLDRYVRKSCMPQHKCVPEDDIPSMTDLERRLTYLEDKIPVGEIATKRDIPKVPTDLVTKADLEALKALIPAPSPPGTVIPDGNPELNVSIDCQYNFGQKQAICKVGLEYLHDVVGRWLKLGGYVRQDFTGFGSDTAYTQDLGTAFGDVTEKVRRHYTDLGAVLSTSVIDGDLLELGFRVGLVIAYGEHSRTTDILGDKKTISRDLVDAGVETELFVRTRLPLHQWTNGYAPDITFDVNGGYVMGVGVYLGGSANLDLMPLIRDAIERDEP